MTLPDQSDPLLGDAADHAATDRIAWAMLVVSGEQSPRAVWAAHADEWRGRAEGVWRSAYVAARAASQCPTCHGVPQMQGDGHGWDDGGSYHTPPCEACGDRGAVSRTSDETSAKEADDGH